MIIYQISAVLILAVFYIAYFTKMMLQKRRGIRTNQINQGTKPPETRRVEKIMRITTVAVVIAELLSIYFNRRIAETNWLITVGLIIAFLGDLLFIAAMATMRDSWRAGINEEEKTKLVTRGIYQYSRNPAFLGFDLVYIGILLAFFNLPLLFFSLMAVISLHLQICREEVYLPTVFGDSYIEYQKHTCRYFGKKRAAQ